MTARPKTPESEDSVQASRQVAPSAAGLGGSAPPAFRSFRAAPIVENSSPAPLRPAEAIRRRREALWRARWGDRLGICLSGLCILHCALTPVALAALPSMNVFFFREQFHAFIALFIGASAVLAFVPGYRAHGDARVFAWAVSGFGFIVFAAFWGGAFFGHYGEAAISILGSVLLIQAHRLNRALCACCRSHRRAVAPST